MSKMLTIQPSKPSELTELYKLERLCHQHPWSLAILKDCMKVGYLCHSFKIPCQSNCKALNLIGFMINHVILDECHLLNICIHPQYRGQGYAKSALNWLFDILKSKAVKKLFLEVRVSNVAARQLYEHLGFDVIGERKGYYPKETGRETAIVMQKLL